jgi:hypothetical protein
MIGAQKQPARHEEFDGLGAPGCIDKDAVLVHYRGQLDAQREAQTHPVRMDARLMQLVEMFKRCDERGKATILAVAVSQFQQTTKVPL